MMTRAVVLLVALGGLSLGAAQDLSSQIESRIPAEMPKVIAWRRDFHQHPELSNREARTSKIVADHLRALGLEVKTGVAKTGVVGLLRGGRPGPVVALRADMDGLPVKELTDVPFKSTARGNYNGQDVDVMHACGHDSHTAMLMGVAEILASMKAELPGSVKFIFQPAEEGPPQGETGGAGDMVAEGALESPNVDAIFGMHVWPGEVGTLMYRSGGTMASSDRLRIIVHGRGTHGAMPWGGVDPIAVSAEIIMGLQTIVSRQLDITNAPAIVTIGRIEGGTRYNIIPESVVMEGTLRALDPDMQKDLHARVRRTAQLIAQSAGAEAEIEIENTAPVTYNDPKLTERMAPTLLRVAGPGRASIIPPQTPSEDFSKFQQKVPGMYFFLGINKAGADPATAPRNHSPYFLVNEDALPVGVRVMANLAVDYLSKGR
jgi:amidohydrolase